MMMEAFRRNVLLVSVRMRVGKWTLVKQRFASFGTGSCKTRGLSTFV